MDNLINDVKEDASNLCQRITNLRKTLEALEKVYKDRAFNGIIKQVKEAEYFIDKTDTLISDFIAEKQND